MQGDVRDLHCASGTANTENQNLWCLNVCVQGIGAAFTSFEFEGVGYLRVANMRSDNIVDILQSEKRNQLVPKRKWEQWNVLIGGIRRESS